MKLVYRQGDVILESRHIPKSSVRKEGLVLARGEVTGHAHQITEGNAVLYEYNGILYLRVESDTSVLTHEEHAPITLPQGEYEVKIQREYEPGGWRNISD